MAVVTMKQLLGAGVHFGHQTRRWNPKMRRFILGERNGIYLIDLRQTMKGIEESYSYIRDLVAGGGTILFVGTKKQTQGPVAIYADACGMPYVNERWLGGMLTNFQTVSTRVKRMKEFEAMQKAGDFDAMPKKEALRHTRELEKLQRNLGGIRSLDRLPDAIFVIDTKKEHIAVTEANKLGLPVVAVVDTNCDPDVITHVIPGNDDAIRSGALLCRVVADAVVEGRFIAQQRPTPPPAAAPVPAPPPPPAPAPAGHGHGSGALRRRPVHPPDPVRRRPSRWRCRRDSPGAVRPPPGQPRPSRWPPQPAPAEPVAQPATGTTRARTGGPSSRRRPRTGHRADPAHRGDLTCPNSPPRMCRSSGSSPAWECSMPKRPSRRPRGTSIGPSRCSASRARPARPSGPTGMPPKGPWPSVVPTARPPSSSSGRRPISWPSPTSSWPWSPRWPIRWPPRGSRPSMSAPTRSTISS